MTVRDVFVHLMVYNLQIEIIETSADSFDTLDTINDDTESSLFIDLVNHKKDYENREVAWVSVNPNHVTVCLKPEEKK